MKLIITLLLLGSTLFASNILSYKVYDRSDRTDLLLTFDTPFNGRISQKKALNKTTLLLYNANYTKQVEKSLPSHFISSFSIIPQNKRTALVLTLQKDTQFKVSKTVDNYGLRLRFYKSKTATASSKTVTSQNLPSSSISSTLPTQTTGVSNDKYILVVVILLLAVVGLFVIKRKMDKKGSGGGWLFKNQPAPFENFNILFQKPIDNVNKVVLLEVNQRQYLVVLGNSHLLLDTFVDKQNIDQEGFESILQENQQELDSYMQIDNTKSTDPLQSYKDKASIEAYRSNM
jgi:hypothetical protein